MQRGACGLALLVTSGGNAKVRMSSISGINGALGDMGQNYKNLAFLAAGLFLALKVFPHLESALDLVPRVGLPPSDGAVVDTAAALFTTPLSIRRYQPNVPSELTP